MRVRHRLRTSRRPFPKNSHAGLRPGRGRPIVHEFLSLLAGSGSIGGTAQREDVRFTVTDIDLLPFL